MLGEALAALASAGGTALVTAMVTDGWEGLRARLARLLGRGDVKAEAAVLARLDDSRTALMAAARVDAGQIQQQLEAAWRACLEDFLVLEPGAADELRALIAEARAMGSAVAGRVQVNAAAFGKAQQAVQGQGVQNVTFGQRGPGDQR